MQLCPCSYRLARIFSPLLSTTRLPLTQLEHVLDSLRVYDAPSAIYDALSARGTRCRLLYDVLSSAPPPSFHSIDEKVDHTTVTKIDPVNHWPTIEQRFSTIKNFDLKKVG